MKDFFRRLFHPIKHRRFRQGKKIKSRRGFEFGRDLLRREPPNPWFDKLVGKWNEEERKALEITYLDEETPEGPNPYEGATPHLTDKDRLIGPKLWGREYMNKTLEPEPTTSPSPSERERKRQSP